MNRYFRSYRTVYFHALTSTKEFSVPNYVLRDEARATNRSFYYDYTYLGSRGSHGPSAVESFDDDTNVLFYTKITENAIGCWQANNTYTPNNHGSITLLGYPSDVKIQGHTNATIWALSNQLPAFLKNKTLSSEHVNYRVWFGKTSTIIKGNR